jgi:hypothetical protein
MTIQRQKHEITTHEHHNEPDTQAVQLIVYVKGDKMERGDALLMIIDAWSEAMKQEGLDPKLCFQKFVNEGTLN